jgi:hypothetical protein
LSSSLASLTSTSIRKTHLGRCSGSRFAHCGTMARSSDFLKESPRLRERETATVIRGCNGTFWTAGSGGRLRGSVTTHRGGIRPAVQTRPRISCSPPSLCASNNVARSFVVYRGTIRFFPTGVASAAQASRQTTLCVFGSAGRRRNSFEGRRSITWRSRSGRAKTARIFDKLGTASATIRSPAWTGGLRVQRRVNVSDECSIDIPQCTCLTRRKSKSSLLSVSRSSQDSRPAPPQLHRSICSVVP